MPEAVRADAPAPGRPFLARPRTGVTELAVVVYHYVREPKTSRFPLIKGVSLDDFRGQLQLLRERYEMATLESALAFLNGAYRPVRSLCLLTFDDGLKDHSRDVFPLLAAERIQGLFFLTTGCLEGRVAGVHKTQHLMASLEFATYRTAFMDRLAAMPVDAPAVDPIVAGRAYPWDTQEVADFKYLLNYQLAPEWRRQALDALFGEFIGDEQEFANDFYLDTADAREMQADGMIVGGHSHEHSPLSTLDEPEQQHDLSICASRLRAELHPQESWPFSYPYGYFNSTTIECLRATEFSCAFALDGGANSVAHDPFRIRRIDTKDLVF